MLRLRNRDLRDLVQGSALIFVVKGIALVAAFGMHVSISRSLGAAEAGLFFLAYTIVLLAAGFGRLGLEFSLLRFVARYRADAMWGRIRGVYRRGISWSLWASLPIAAGLYLWSPFLAESLFGKPELSGIMRVAALAIPCLSLATLHAFALQGLKHITKSVLILNVTIPVTATALIVLMWPQSGNEVAWYLVAASLATLLLSWYWWRAVAPAAVAATPPNARELRASCLPMLVGVVVSQLIAWSGQIMLGVWGDSADVAVFNAAQRTTATMAILVASVNSILAPKFASSYAGRYDLSMQRITRSGTTLLVLAATLPAVGFLVAAEHILAVFGAEFAHGALALRVLTVGYFLHVAAGAQGYLLAMTGHEREVRNSVLMAAATSITLGLVLVPTWHLLGAALSTAVGVALQNLFCAWFAWRRLIVPARLSTDR